MVFKNRIVPLKQVFSELQLLLLFAQKLLKLLSILKIIKNDNSKYIGDKKIQQIRIVKMQLGSSDESGRRTPESILGLDENLDTDLIIEALGFEPKNLPKMFDRNELTVTQWGTLKINYKTTSYPKEYPPDEPRRRCPDISNAKKNLNYYPRISLKEGLKRHFTWSKNFLNID